MKSETMEITETMEPQVTAEPTQEETLDQGLSGPTKEALSETARQRGAVVLEVLAGTIQPGDAAEHLQIKVPAYYNLEARALQALVKACEPRPKGPSVNYQKQIRELQEINRKLEREARRYQSLTRAAQKAIGLGKMMEKSGSAKANKGTGKKKRGARKKVRALRAAERLRGAGESSAKKKQVVTG